VSKEVIQERVFACIFTALHGMFFRTKPNESLASHFADLRAFAAKILQTVEMTVKKFSKARLSSVHALLARACGMI